MTAKSVGVGIGIVVAMIGFGSTACRNDDSTSNAGRPGGDVSTTTAPADPDHYKVWVDNNKPEGFSATYEYFFPDDLTVHPGATIDFAMDWSSGEPHNVALGTTVDGAREAIDALPPQDTTISPGMPLPVTPELQAKFAKMPQALPPDRATTADTMRQAQPCFIEAGDPPLDTPCGPEQRASSKPFDGTQSFVSSQVMINDGDHFEITLAPTIKPGKYSYLCTLHPSFMYGSINVVPKSESKVDTPAEVSARGQAAIDELNVKYRPVAEKISAQSAPAADAGGLGDDGKRPEITLNVFPAQINATTNEPVTWNVVGAHMFTFSPPPDRKGFAVLEERDGVVQPLDWQPDNPSSGRTGMPAFSEVINAMVTKNDVLVDGGAISSGEYVHSGLLFGSLGPLPKTLYSLQFKEPGTYTYYCARHPGMAGTVAVTE